MLEELLDRSVVVENWPNSRPSKQRPAVLLAAGLTLPASVLYAARPEIVFEIMPKSIGELYSIFSDMPLLPWLMLVLMVSGFMIVWPDVASRTRFAQLICVAYVAASFLYCSLFLVTFAWMIIGLAGVVGLLAVVVGGVYGVGRKLIQGRRGK